MHKQPINEFLTTLRKAKGLTQQEVADKLGISNRTLSSWESGRAYPDILTLPALADIYGVTADEILRGERLPSAETDISEKSQKMLLNAQLARFSVKNIALIFVTVGGAILSMILYLFWTLGLILISVADCIVVISLFIGYYYNATLPLTYTDKEDWTDLHYNYFKALRKKGVVTFIFAISAWFVCGGLGILLAIANFPSLFFYLFFAESLMFLVTFLIWYVSESKRNGATKSKK